MSSTDVEALRQQLTGEHKQLMVEADDAWKRLQSVTGGPNVAAFVAAEKNFQDVARARQSVEQRLKDLG